MNKKAFVKNAADPNQVKAGGLKERDKRRVELEDIMAVMSLPQGRRLIWRVINELCHFDAISAQHSGSMTYLAEGERNIGRILKGDAYEAAFEEYQQMEKEHITSILGDDVPD